MISSIWFERRAKDADGRPSVKVTMSRMCMGFMRSVVSGMTVDLVMTYARSTTMFFGAFGQCRAADGECQNNGEWDCEAFHGCGLLLGDGGGLREFLGRCCRTKVPAMFCRRASGEQTDVLVDACCTSEVVIVDPPQLLYGKSDPLTDIFFEESKNFLDSEATCRITMDFKRHERHEKSRKNYKLKISKDAF